MLNNSSKPIFSWHFASGDARALSEGDHSCIDFNFSLMPHLYTPVNAKMLPFRFAPLVALLGAAAQPQLLLQTCKEGSPDQLFSHSQDVNNHLVHIASGMCVQMESGCCSGEEVRAGPAAPDLRQILPVPDVWLAERVVLGST